MAASRSPQNLDDDTWYYEYPTYLCLVRRVRNAAGDYLKTESVKITWRKLKVSLERAYKPRKKTTAKRQRR